ncbi:MAG TPA: hypothetical protein PLY88_06870, partial [Candidatus Omnitrophota bacterium]|nr:hypothetical protein [Candidatus Omnitrophota bacterium]
MLEIIESKDSKKSNQDGNEILELFFKLYLSFLYLSSAEPHTDSDKIKSELKGKIMGTQDKGKEK